MTIFDSVYDREHTHSVKWDSIKQTYHEPDLLPLWVADMDFKMAEPIAKQLHLLVDEGILGYTDPSNELYQAVQEWQKRRNKYVIPKEAILFSPGVIPSIVQCIQALTKIDDAIMIHDPVYYPFARSVQTNQRRLIRSALIESNGHYIMDFADMEKKIIQEKIKMFIFCNPQNPGGRVWTKQELNQLGKLCQKHQVILISDEIHQDLIYNHVSFSTFNNADPEFRDFSIILTAATKTFNLAGIKNSMIFVENPDYRQKLITSQKRNCQNEINTFGLVATQVAYQKGEGWLDELMEYLWNNFLIVKDFFETEFPNVQVMTPEGTYLVWLNFEAEGYSDKELENLLIHKGKVVLNQGRSFGPQGAHHLRLNLACPKKTLIEGLHRIELAFR